jgi:Wiskott-Aldrich syndrome protein
LLRKDSAQYPACFFEDDEDDEAAPLRRRLQSWTMRGSGGEGRRSKGRFDRTEESFGRKFRRVVFCGCGGR